MDEQEMLKIKHLLLRRVAESNKILARKINAGVIGANRYNIGFANLLQDFAGGANNRMLNRILADIEHRNGVSPHNYFDIDTLYAYSKYLDMLIVEIDRQRRANRVGSNTSDQYSRASRITARWLVDRAYTAETGYYDKSAPIKPETKVVDGYVRLNPTKTLSEKDFERKGYRIEECEYLLKKYIESKHQKSKPSSFTQITLEQQARMMEQESESEAFKSLKDHVLATNSKQRSTAIDFDSSEIDVEYIEYKGRKYTIDSKDYYRSYPDEMPVYHIIASTRDGRTIVGTFDVESQVYYGDVYDNENNLVFTREDSGVQEFFSHIPGEGANHNKIVKDNTRASKRKPTVKSGKQPSDNQMHLDVDDHEIL